MRTLDETDLEILEALLVDSRRPYSEIARRVELSPPTVSDRVDHLHDLGVIERFTLDLDWSMLSEGVPVLIDLHVHPGSVEDVRSTFEDADGVEQIFVTADSHVVVRANLPRETIRDAVSGAFDGRAVRDYDVRLLVDSERSLDISGDVSVAVTCDECGHTATSGGRTSRLDERLYQFCCAACQARFQERYEKFQERPEQD